MFHSLATRNECDAFSSGQFSRSAKDPISPFFFSWQGLRAGIRAIPGTVAQCRKSASNPFLALWHFILKAFLIVYFFTILTHYWRIDTHSPSHYVNLNMDKEVHIQLFTVITYLVWYCVFLRDILRQNWFEWGRILMTIKLLRPHRLYLSPQSLLAVTKRPCCSVDSET